MSRGAVVYRGMAETARLLYLLMGWRVEVTDPHLLPATGPVVLVANHVSHIDPLHLALAALKRHRRLAFLAKRELFRHRLIGPLVRGSEQIEVDRGGDASSSIEPAVEVLRQGSAVCVFPEGTISPSFVPAPPRPGAARMALEAGVPLVPVALWGGQRILTKGHKATYTRGVVMTVRFGAPILPLGDEDPRHLTARVWREVMALVETSALSYPQRPAGPDDTWWVPAHHGGDAPTIAQALDLLRREDAERHRRRAAERAAQAHAGDAPT